jgi:hypothetical protein
MYMLCISSPFIHRQNICKNYPVTDHNFRTVLDRSYPQYLITGVNIVGNLYIELICNSSYLW